jgi:uncharacterized protein (TIGR02598 family)
MCNTSRAWLQGGRFRCGGGAAFSLIEVTLAIGVVAFCLLAIFGLIPIGLRTNKAAVQQTAANGILSAVIADLRATPSTLPLGSGTTSQEFGIFIPANTVTSGTTLYFDGSGQPTSALNGIPSGGQTPAQSEYLLTVNFIPSPSGPRAATFVNLEVSWPAASGTANAEGSVQDFVALDRN